MKKFAVAACAGLLFTPLVQAQSRVNIFGLVDLGVTAIRNTGGGRLIGLSHSNTGPSRLGFEGVEDLGDEMYANFRLEAQVRPDTGDSNTTKFFNRQATVGLGSKRYGEVRLGRDTPPSYRITTNFDPFTANGIAADINVPSASPNANNGPSSLRIATYAQADNLVSYYLPPYESIGGLLGQFTVAPGEGANKYSGGYLGWRNRTTMVGAHVSRTRPAPGSVVADYRNSGVGGSYQFPTRTKVMGLLQDERFQRVAAVDYREKWWLVGMVQYFGERNELRLSYIKRNSTGTAAESARDVTLKAIGYVHGLSARTSLFAMYAQMQNGGTGTYYIPNGPATISPGGTSRGIDIGMKHIF